jgi:hypothetical protein
MDTALEVRTTTAMAEPSSQLIETISKLPPRDMEVVQNSILHMVTVNPKIAEAAIYCRPVGKSNGRQKFAIGQSIRFCEIGQQAFGYILVDSRVERDKNSINATTKVFDLKTCNIYHGYCSKSILKRDGTRVSSSQEEVMVSAALSISRRNGLIQAMKPQLDALMDDVKRAALSAWCKDGNFNSVEAKKAIAQDFKTRWGTESVDLQKLTEDEKTEEDKTILALGVRNFLIDNPESYYDVFGKNAAGEKNAPKIPTAKVETERAEVKNDPVVERMAKE